LCASQSPSAPQVDTKKQVCYRSGELKRSATQKQEPYRSGELRPPKSKNKIEFFSKLFCPTSRLQFVAL